LKLLLFSVTPLYDINTDIISIKFSEN